MPTESNTPSDLGPNAGKPVIKSYDRGETRHIVPAETPRERMNRVVKTVHKRKKKW